MTSSQVGASGAGVVNMVDVAERAGVSTATVSRALRDLPGVSPRTRARIRQVAEDLAYVVSPEASRLATRSTGRVAVVVPRVDIWFYAAMLSGIERVLRRADLDVLVYQVDGPRERAHFFKELPARRKVDAVVLVALPVLAEEEDRLDLLGVRLVVAGGRLGAHPHVHTDDEAVAALAVDHLADLGHRRVVMLRTDDTAGTRWSSDIERTRGFLAACDRRGLPTGEESVVTTPYAVDAGARAVDVLAARGGPGSAPTALFAYSDELGVAATARLRATGLRVPEDVSVVGVDDNPLAAAVGLTTVDQGVVEQARRSGEMAARLVDEGILDPGTALVVPPRLVVRSTTGPPPGQRTAGEPR